MRKTVLIVEDEPFYQDMLAKTVEGLGLDAVIKEDGVGAILYMHSHATEISAVLLDIYMPKVDGISTLGHLRNKHPELPIIIITGSSDDDDERIVKTLGITAFLKKPFTPDHIQDLLRNTLFGSMPGIA